MMTSAPTLTAPPAEAGTITRVSGPVVEAHQMRAVRMYEVVEVGPLRLTGEVVRVQGDLATIQVYENTSGLKTGQPVRRTGAALSVTLGPGLVGQIFDGIQRPLETIWRSAQAYIPRGVKTPALDPERRWHFAPVVGIGETVRPGARIGTVPETPLVEHRVLVPADLSGTVTWVAGEGDYTVAEPIARLEAPGGEQPVTLGQRWPVRTPRPFAERTPLDRPLITGQRIIDAFFPLARGGTAAIPGGFGTGKTITQHALAKWSEADLIVYIGCGERGNEMVDVLEEFPRLTDPRSGRSLMERTILIANTSNMPVAAREVSIYTGITIAEYYRDMGYHVGVMADSTSAARTRPAPSGAKYTTAVLPGCTSRPPRVRPVAAKNALPSRSTPRKRRCRAETPGRKSCRWASARGFPPAAGHDQTAKFGCAVRSAVLTRHRPPPSGTIMSTRSVGRPPAAV